MGGSSEKCSRDGWGLEGLTSGEKVKRAKYTLHGSEEKKLPLKLSSKGEDFIGSHRATGCQSNRMKLSKGSIWLCQQKAPCYQAVLSMSHLPREKGSTVALGFLV